MIRDKSIPRGRGMILMFSCSAFFHYWAWDERHQRFLLMRPGVRYELEYASERLPRSCLTPIFEGKHHLIHPK